MFGSDLDRGKFLEALQSDPKSMENVLAMTHIGFAFCEICTFEDLVSSLVRTSKATMKSKLDAEAVTEGDLFMERYQSAKKSTLGNLMKVIEKSGIEGRDIRYLHAIVKIRNQFIHDFMSSAPLPGDWERYNYTLESFVAYTEYVWRHVNFAKSHFSRIMVKHGLLGGNFGSYGALLWNPDFPFPNDEEK